MYSALLKYTLGVIIRIMSRPMYHQVHDSLCEAVGYGGGGALASVLLSLSIFT